MLVFDQLKKNDTQLRLLAVGIFAGLFVLFAGLWWVQVVRAREYRASLETQSFRSVRVSAVRGKVLDRNGRALAESRPNYSINLYFEDLSETFRKEYARQRPRKVVTNDLPAWKSWLGATAVTTQRVKLNDSQVEALNWQVRYEVGNGIVQQVAAMLKQPLVLDFDRFCRHYTNRRALPYPILENLDSVQVARFEEQASHVLSADLETETRRIYPFGTTASHVLGYVRKDNDSVEGEHAFYSYRQPDYRGVVGIEGAFDEELRGHAGAKSVLVNNLGYRQNEKIWAAPEAGKNVILTLDVRLQQAAERALRQRAGNNVRGAVVVMDVQSGDILALASAPASDPNYLIRGFPAMEEYARWTNSTLGLQKNRATQEHYQAGSIFKTVVGLAALESGLDPEESYYVEPNRRNPHRGIVQVGNQSFNDLAPPGDYNFRRALLKSSNAYFITMGRRAGIERIIELGRRLHLGERMNIPTMQEAAGEFPSFKRVKSNWHEGDTANICIGQGEMAVTPLQMGVLTCALANGGKVLWPRLVSRVEPQDPFSTDPPVDYPARRIRDELRVSPHSLAIVRDAMLAETEDPEGTGYKAFRDFYRGNNGMRVCGKTGTAERTEHGRARNTTWFVSFAPYESPRYAVVVMVEDGVSGGATCAPVAHDVYKAILDMQAADLKPLAKTN